MRAESSDPVAQDEVFTQYHSAVATRNAQPGHDLQEKVGEIQRLVILG